MSIISDALEVIHDGFNRLTGRADAVEKKQSDLEARVVDLEKHFDVEQIKTTLDKLRASQGSAPTPVSEPVADAAEHEIDPDTGLPVTA